MQIVMVNVISNKETLNNPQNANQKGGEKSDQINITMHMIPLTEDAPGDGPI